VIVKQR